MSALENLLSKGIEGALCVTEDSKEFYEVDAETYFMVYTSNGAKNAGTESYRALFSLIMMTELEKNGIKTNLAYNKVLCVDGKYGLLVKKCESIPIKWISSFETSGSVLKIFPELVKRNKRFFNPVHRYEYISDTEDKIINESYIIGLNILTRDEFIMADTLVVKIENVLSKLWKNININLIDAEVKFAKCSGNVLVVYEINQFTVPISNFSKFDEQIKYEEFVKRLYPGYMRLVESV